MPWNEETKKKYPINPDWKDYYIILEGIRQSGIVNMWGASPVLASVAGISQDLAADIHLSWITNYDELKNTYWPNPDEHFWVNLSSKGV